MIGKTVPIALRQGSLGERRPQLGAAGETEHQKGEQKVYFDFKNDRFHLFECFVKF
jgi:hypothetical protein